MKILSSPSALLLLALSVFPRLEAAGPEAPPPLPASAKLVLDENWSTGRIEPARWYIPRKKWGQGNNGVSPKNVWVQPDVVGGKTKPVLVCRAHGDLYKGPVVGQGGRKDRVGGIVVTREFFASGRYQVVMKVGGTEARLGGPADPRRPIGTVPAIWTYGYRYVSVPKADMKQFQASQPLYNPHLNQSNYGANEYWSELDFPEFGKDGNFEKALYNTFLQNKHQSRTFDVTPMIDGKYHTLTTDWRTQLLPIEGVKDSQVVAKHGYHWVQDLAVPYKAYWGNPLKRLGKDKYAVYAGLRADHYIDGKKVGENLVFVPSMAGQLTLGIWLPEWAGKAPWEEATASFASVKVWQFNDPGDVRGVITENITDTYREDGSPLR